MELTECKLGA